MSAPYAPKGDPEFMPMPAQDREVRLQEIANMIVGRAPVPAGVSFAELANEVRALHGHPVPASDVKAALETLERAGAQVEVKMHALTGELVLTIELSAAAATEG